MNLARHEFATYNEGVYKWLYTKLTKEMTVGWPPGEPREPAPLARSRTTWPQVTEWPAGATGEPFLTIERGDLADRGTKQNPNAQTKVRHWLKETERDKARRKAEKESIADQFYRCRISTCPFKCT